MAAIEIQWNPTDRQLRQFGAATFFVLPLSGWLLAGRPGWVFPWTTENSAMVGGLLTCGAFLLLVGWFVPRALKPYYIGLMLATFPIGLIVGEVFLLLLYILVFLPVALIFRLIGRDALQRRIDRQAESYWEPKSPPPDPASYYRQS